jgi:C-terminal processing protease CtpA/Prc
MRLFLVRFSTGLCAVAVATSLCFAQQQNTNPPQSNQDQQEQLKKQAEQARQEARDKAEEARKKAQDTRQENQANRQENRDERQHARDETQEHRQDARKDQRDARDSSREERRDAREENRDGRQDNRQETRDQRGERVRSFFRGRTSSDLGLRFDENRAERLTVLDLDRNGMGARIGLRRGDVIVSIDGSGIRTGEDFNRSMNANTDRASSIMIERGGRQYTLQMQPWSDQQNRYSYEPGNAGQRRAYLGVTFDPNYREFAVVREVKEDSPAKKAGLQPGDTLTHINGQELRSLQHALRMISMMPVGEEFELEFDRPKHETVRVSLAERENRSQATFDNSDQRRDERQDRQENRQDQQD